ncbi:MAG TPA: hypothetical protein VLF63_01275 [Patescibacteria group bacterium]|nr:hypothetical protein [Patescibacteria group bacterium]
MNRTVLFIICAVIILGGGAYLIFHKSSKPTLTNSSSSVNNSVIVTKSSSNFGNYLADPSGKTLYIYNGDNSGVSNCSGSCLSNWPPYVASSGVGNLPSGVSTIKRNDSGQLQYSYNGMPLYYFKNDSTGQVSGNGVDNFSLAKPSASTSTQPSTNSPSTSTPQPNNSNNSPSYNY